MRYWKDIKSLPKINGRIEVVENGSVVFRCWIGDYAEIGDQAEIGSMFPQVSISGKWWLHPYAPGMVRLGCYIGDYATLRAREEADWGKHGYTDDHVKAIIATLDYFEANEDLIFMKEER